MKARVAPYPKSEQFGAAIDLLEEARRRHDSAEWTDPVDVMVVEVRQSAKSLLKSLVPKALDAKARGAGAEVSEIKARVSRWGVTTCVSDFDKELSSPPPRVDIPAGGLVLLKFPPGETKNYQLLGRLEGGALVGNRAPNSLTLGFNNPSKGIFHFPVEGEVRLSYFTMSPKPLLITCRVTLEEGHARSYGWRLVKPEVGKPAQAVARLQDFRDVEGHPVRPGGLVGSLTIVAYPDAELKVTEVTIG